jgi:lysophospholipase L1-like esterase
MSLTLIILSLSGGSTGTTGGGGGGGGTSVTRLAGEGDSQFGGAGYGAPVITAASTLGVPVHNFSHSGYTTAALIPYVSSEILALSPAPSHCCLNSGVNDVNSGRTTAQIIDDYDTILGLLTGASIIPVIIKIPGWSNGSNTQNAQIDDINAGIASLCATSYPDAVFVDDRALICQFRSGGTAGNLWDLQPAYTEDGVHLNPTANGIRADAIVSALE